MSDDQFTKLFRYFESFRKEVNERFDKHDREFVDMRGTISDLSVDVRDTKDELLILNHQFENLSGRVNHLSGQFDNLSHEVANLSGQFTNLSGQVSKGHTAIKEIATATGAHLSVDF